MNKWNGGVKKHKKAENRILEMEVMKMKFPSKKVIELLRKKYPVGTRVELVFMDDVQAPPIGTKGT